MEVSMTGQNVMRVKPILPEFPDRTVCITEYKVCKGVMSDEAGRINGTAINSAIKDVSEAGGGTVVIPEGIWASSPIELKSNVRLYLNKQAVLKFTKNKEDYPLIITNYEGQQCIRTVSPIHGENLTNIAIAGDGLIDGSGDLWRPVKGFKVTERQWKALLGKSDKVLKTKESEVWFPSETAYEGNNRNIQGNTENILKEAADFYDFYRPVMVSLKHCSKVLLEGVTFLNSPAWNIHPFFCDNLTVRDIKVRNPYYAQNGDGIDVESCDTVEICDSVFETGDDAICLKSGKNAEARTFEGPCQNVYIHDCVVNEGHGGFVIGSEMSRGVKDVYVENCTFRGTDVGVRIKSALGRGGVVENITVRNVNMINILGEAVIMTMGYVLNLLDKNETIAGQNEEDIPYFRDILIDKVTCTGCKVGIKLEPLSDRPDTISNITVENSTFVAACDNIIAGKNINVE